MPCKYRTSVIKNFKVCSTLLLKFVCHAFKISNHTIHFKIFYVDVQLIFNFFWYTDSFVIIAFRSTQLNLSEKVVWSRIEKKSFGYLEEFRALKLCQKVQFCLWGTFGHYSVQSFYLEPTVKYLHTPLLFIYIYIFVLLHIIH